MPSIYRIPVKVRTAVSPDRQALSEERPLAPQTASAGGDHGFGMGEVDPVATAEMDGSPISRDAAPAVREPAPGRWDREPCMDTAEGEHHAFLTSLLDVADNLERALSFGQEGDPLTEGVALTNRALQRALAQARIEPIESRGQPFDPNLHEAVALVPSKLAEGLVVAEEQRGYTYRDRLLRPAKVQVSAGERPGA